MYRADLAYVHHVGFADVSQHAGVAILKMLNQKRPRGGTVVDLGCGDGQWLRRLSDAGYNAIGIDASRAFVRLARQTAPNADVRLGSLWEFAFPKCCAVTAVGEVLSYLMQGSTRPPPLPRLFANIYAALEPGGLFVFDMLTRSNGSRMQYRTWKAGAGWAVLIDVNESPRNARMNRTIHTFRKSRGRYQRSTERHVSRIVSRDTVVRTLRDLGFAVRTSTMYGNYRLPPRRTVFHAVRRRS